jgi:hypothetical protein
VNKYFGFLEPQQKQRAEIRDMQAEPAKEEVEPAKPKLKMKKRSETCRR